VAELRKSAKTTAARERARAQAAQFREREDTLEALAVDYFTYIEQIDEVNAAADAEIERIREQATRNTADRQKSAHTAVVAMLTAGTSRAEVSARLGITVKDVRRATEGSTPPPTVAPNGDTVEDAPNSFE
jgi:hypothetical protein